MLEQFYKKQFNIMIDSIFRGSVEVCEVIEQWYGLYRQYIWLLRIIILCFMHVFVATDGCLLYIVDRIRIKMGGAL